MNIYINYLIEANLGLCLFMIVYAIFLRKENDFVVKRYFLLTSVFCSLLFPFLHFETGESVIPSIGQMVPVYWLPEIVIGDNGGVAGNSAIGLSVWNYFEIVYCTGVAVFLVLFMIQVIKLLWMIKKSTTYRYGKFNIAESNEDKPIFSFFNFIFIGQANLLSENEKQQIIRHESIHTRYLHSFDILLLSLIGIFFWFNPIIKIYKKIFVHLHEFEADARAVEKHEVNNYCNLLARVAILSADLQLANHFNHSLTLKRIEMMRTIKKKIKNWKFLGMTTVTGIFFFVVACQEQVMTEVTNTVQSSTMALEIPPQVSDQIAKMEKENPGSKVIALELNDEGKKSLKKIEEQQGLPTSMNVMTIQDKDFEKNGLVRTYAVVVYNGQAQKLADLAKTDDNIYTVVEESAMPEGGIGAFYEIIQKNLKYPVEARTNRVEGKIFVEFVVQTDGSLSDLKILKGLGHGLDEEALRVVKLSPKWTPGKHQGIIVKQRMVLPLSFRLGGLEKSSYRETTNPENSLSEIVAIGYIRQ